MKCLTEKSALTKLVEQKYHHIKYHHFNKVKKLNKEQNYSKKMIKEVIEIDKYSANFNREDNNSQHKKEISGIYLNPKKKSIVNGNLIKAKTTSNLKYTNKEQTQRMYDTPIIKAMTSTWSITKKKPNSNL